MGCRGAPVPFPPTTVVSNGIRNIWAPQTPKCIKPLGIFIKGFPSFMVFVLQFPPPRADVFMSFWLCCLAVSTSTESVAGNKSERKLGSSQCENSVAFCLSGKIKRNQTKCLSGQCNCVGTNLESSRTFVTNTFNTFFGYLNCLQNSMISCSWFVLCSTIVDGRIAAI